MTRAEREQHQIAQAQAQITAGKRALQMIHSAQRKAALDARDTRRVEVGTLVEECGLSGLDNAVLKKALIALRRMSVTDPKAVEEFIGLDAILHGDVDLIQVVGEHGKSLGPAAAGYHDAGVNGQ